MTNKNRREALLSLTAFAAVLGLAHGARAASHSKTHSVSIAGFKFAPTSLTINAGDQVEFTNDDGAPHTATASNGSFDTGRLAKGKSKTIRFDDAGTVDYVCAFHPNMKGKIIVR